MSPEEIAKIVTSKLELDPPITKFTVLGLQDWATYEPTVAILRERYGNEVASKIIQLSEGAQSEATLDTHPPPS